MLNCGEAAAALQSLKNNWENVPPSWHSSNDPCATPPWDGVTCNNAKVTALLVLPSLSFPIFCYI